MRHSSAQFEWRCCARVLMFLLSLDSGASWPAQRWQRKLLVGRSILRCEINVSEARR